MTKQHAVSLSDRLAKKYQARQTARAKELQALKAMTVKGLMAKMGAVTAYNGSRTHQRIAEMMTARNHRLAVLKKELMA